MLISLVLYSHIKTSYLISHREWSLSYVRHFRFVRELLSKCNVDDCQNVIWKSNFAFLQSSLNCFQAIILAKCVLTILELNLRQQFRDEKKNLKICWQVLTSCFIQLQNTSFHGVDWTRTAVKWPKMKNARAKRAELLFFIVKYANLWHSCLRRRRGCWSTLIDLMSSDPDTR